MSDAWRQQVGKVGMSFNWSARPGQQYVQIIVSCNHHHLHHCHHRLHNRFLCCCLKRRRKFLTLFPKKRTKMEWNQVILTKIDLTYTQNNEMQSLKWDTLI